jgi:hypothetical protein
MYATPRRSRGEARAQQSPHASRPAATDLDAVVPFKLEQRHDRTYMNVIMIDYDLVIPGQKYDKIIGYIKGHNAWANPLKSTWLVKTSKSAAQVCDDLLAIIDANDKLLVTDVTGDPMAWYGLSDEVSDWITNNVPTSLVR